MNPNMIERISNDDVSFDKKVRMNKRQFKSPQWRKNYAKDMALFAKAAEATGINLKKFANLERRKQHKVRYDTWRRPEIPTADDIKLENIYYANFLGDKYGDNGSPYNNQYNVNLRFCDSMAEYEKPAEYEQPAIELDDSLTKRARQMDGEFDYYSDERSLCDSLSELSLGSSDSWVIDIPDEDECEGAVYKTFEEIYAEFGGKYNKASEIDWTVLPLGEDEAERYEEEANFEKMVAYMRRQVELAESIIGVKRSYNEIGGTPKRARCDDESNRV